MEQAEVSKVLLEAQGIKKSFGNLPVLHGIDLTVQAGEIVSITGPSGAGKTTLLQILGTLDTPDAGELRINSHSLLSLKGNKLAQFRNKELGFIFQFHHLLPEFTALENVMMPGLLAGDNVKDTKPRALALLERLGLLHRAGHQPQELSGGEQQRTAVARALLNKPSIIFADEPSGNLDSHNALQLHKLFFELRSELNQTFVIVTHNEELAAQADRQIMMRDGQIEKIISRSERFNFTDSEVLKNL